MNLKNRDIMYYYYKVIKQINYLMKNQQEFFKLKADESE